jgi:hypothetical protein
VEEFRTLSLPVPWAIAFVIASGAFSAGGAWVGSQLRVRSLEDRLAKVERRQGTMLNRLVRLISAHNLNHLDDIDSNRLDGG